MAVTSNTFTGDGSTTNYSFTFEYLEQDEVKVTINGFVTTAFTFANATTLSFTTAPSSGAEIRIYRDTDIDDLKATFFPGSAIKAEDLNNNFTQNNFAVQELRNNTWDVDLQTIKSNEAWVSTDSQIATTAALDQRFQDEVNDTLTKAELAALSDVIPDDDVAVPTTGAVKDYVDHVVETDILVDGTGLNKTSSNGQVTIGISANSVDFDRIKNDDIITSAEQDAGSPSPADSNIFTASASARRFDTLVQTGTPSGSDWELGKTWVQNDSDRTVYIWDGTQWLPIASGGAFTTLPKVVYVDSINGDDNYEAHRLSNPKKTIKAAIDQINADPDGDGSVVIVAPGIYGEALPIDIQKNDISVVGSSLRNCIIHPAIPVADQAGYDVNTPEPVELSTMFRVNSGSYFCGLTLTGMKASGARGGNALDTDATYGLPTNQGWNFAFYPGAVIRKSPYIQNCTNFSDSQINNVNFTPHTPGEGSAGDLDSAPTGGGILIDGSTPDSSSPLRSMVCDSYTHTALDGPGIFITNNGYCQATSSYSFFGHYHLKTKNGGQANLAASTSDFGRYSLIADGRSPNAIFTATTTVNATVNDITFTIGAPVVGAVWHGSATRPQNNMLVDIGGNTYPVLSSVANGAGWDVTVSRPDPANLSNNLGLINNVTSGSAVQFFLRSMIASSGHTMEYVGSGTDYRALPENGGVPNEATQTTELNDGKIWAAITDHKGKFIVGNTFSVDQQSGFITFGAGSFAIPSLIVDLDLNGNNIYDSNGNVTINDTLDLNSNKIVNVTDPTNAQDAATKAYVDTSNYSNSDVDSHLNTSTATTGEVLSWNGSDYDWTSAAAGYTDADVDIHLNRSTAATGEILSWNGSDYDWIAPAASLEGGTDTTSPFNTYLGYQALQDNTTGQSNTALGYQALYNSTTGDYNVGIGSQALRGDTAGSTGDYNIGIGYRAGYTLTTGQYNYFNGYQAGYSVTTGSYNVIIGNAAGTATLSNTVIVADGQGSERFRVDSSGKMGIDQASPASKLDVNGAYAGNIDSTASSTITCSSGNYFTRTISSNTTYTFSSVPASRAYSFTLELTHTSGTVTWPASVKWPADTAPTLTTGKTHLFIFVTDDGGTRWRGAALVDYVN